MDPLTTIARIGNGTLIQKMHAALAAVSAEVIDTGNPAAVTVKLKVSVQNQGDPAVIILEEVSRSVPKSKPKGTYLFTVDGEFFTENPLQPRLEPREVDTSNGEIREPIARAEVVRSIR